MDSEKLQRLGFYLSLIVLSVFYGVAAALLGWFPTDVTVSALDQAHRLIGPPDVVFERVYDRTGARTYLPDRYAPGVTAVTSIWWAGDDGTPALRLLGRDGQILHSWRIGPEVLSVVRDKRPPLGFEELYLHGSEVLPGGDVIVNLEYRGTVRLDACARIRWYLGGGGHHSVTRSANGTFWIPGVSDKPSIESPGHPDGLPGLDHPVYHDYLRRVSADGEVLQRIHVLDLLYRNRLERHILKRRDPGSPDVTHLNDVEALSPGMADAYPLFEANDLLVSLRNLDLVFVVDPDTEKIKWHASHPFLQQHDPDFVGDGWIGVFDNSRDGTPRGDVLGGSRIIALQPHTSSRKVLFPTRHSGPFFTGIGGKWQQLDNGNLLLVEFDAGRAVEVTPDGRTVWEWIVEPYDERWLPAVADATRLELTPREIASWPCSPGDSTDGRETAR